MVTRLFSPSRQKSLGTRLMVYCVHGEIHTCTWCTVYRGEDGLQRTSISLIPEAAGNYCAFAMFYFFCFVLLGFVFALQFFFYVFRVSGLFMLGFESVNLLLFLLYCFSTCYCYYYRRTLYFRGCALNLYYRNYSRYLFSQVPHTAKI